MSLLLLFKQVTTNTVTGNYTANAALLKAASGSFIADSIVKKTASASFTADAELAASAAIGTPVVIARNTTRSIGSTLALTLTTAVSAGDGIFVVAYWRNAPATLSVSDTAGNTYALDIQKPDTTSSMGLLVYSCPNSLALSVGNTITIVGDPADTIKIATAFKVGNLAASNIRDQVVSNNGSSTSLDSTSTPTTTQANELVLGVLTESIKTSASTIDVTGGGGWSEIDYLGTDAASGTDGQERIFYKIVTSTATYAITGSATGTGRWVAAVGTYRGASSPTKSGDFTANAVLRTTLSGSTTADSVIKATLAQTFTADSVLSVKQSGSVTANAIILRTYSPPTPIAIDTFTRSIAINSGWGSADLGGAWSITASQSSTGVDGTAGYYTNSGATAKVAVLGVSVRDPDILFRFRLAALPSAGQTYRINVVARFIDVDNYYRPFIEVDQTGATVLNGQRFIAAVASTYGQGVGPTLVANTWYWGRVRLREIGPTITNFKFWADGSGEPDAWTHSIVDTNDSSLQAPGGVGIRLAASTYDTTASIDDLLVTLPTTADSIIKKTGSSSFTADSVLKSTISTELAFDTFTRSGSNGWGNADFGGAWTNSGGVNADYSVTGTVGRISISALNSSRLVVIGSRQNVDVRVRSALNFTPTGAGSGYTSVVARYIGVGDLYQAILRVTTAGLMMFQIEARYSSGIINITTEADSGLTFSQGAFYWIRLQAEGVSPTTLRAKIWPDGTDEPSGWQHEGTDSSANLQAALPYGVRGLIGTGATNGLPVTIDYDNFRATASAPTSDAILRKIVSQTFSADSTLLAVSPASFTANAIIRKTATGSFAADSVIKRIGQPGSYTADAYFTVIQTGSFTADAVVTSPQHLVPVGDITTTGWTGVSDNTDLFNNLDEQPTPNDGDYIESGSNPTNLVAEFNLSSGDDPNLSTGHWVRIRSLTVGSKASTLDWELRQGAAVIASQTGVAVTTSIATIEYELASGEADSITDYGALSLWINVNSTGGGSPTTHQVTWMEVEVPGSGSQTKTKAFIARAILHATQAGSYNADATIRRTQTGTLTADGFLLSVVSGSATADAELASSISTVEDSFTASSILLKTSSQTATADAYLLNVVSQGLTADSVLFKSIEQSFSANSVILAVIASSASADSMLLTIIVDSITADSTLLVTSQDTFLANAWILVVYSDTFTADAVLFSISSASFTADALITSVTSQTFNADAIIESTTSGSLIADSFLLTITTEVFTADASLLSVFTQQFTADSYLLALVSQTFIADAILSSTTADSFTADALFQQVVSVQFSADAYLIDIVSSDFSADAIFTDIFGDTFTSDSVLFAAGIGSFTADANFLSIPQFSITADASIVIVGTPHWTTPSDTVGIGQFPVLSFIIPDAVSDMHFNIELDTVNTFDGADFRSYDSSLDQTNWEYWDGGTWQAIPSTGVPNTFFGNEARFTITSALYANTWYRHVRAGV